jgi:hypothetical protein
VKRTFFASTTVPIKNKHLKDKSGDREICHVVCHVTPLKNVPFIIMPIKQQQQ